MARRLVERSFDPNKPVVVRRPFTGSGRHYSPGDPFPWRQLSVAQRRVKQLFDNGQLGHPDESPESEAPTPVVTQPPSEETVEPISEETTAETDAPDELDAIDNMAELREIADREGAPRAASKVKQREAIREHREAQ